MAQKQPSPVAVTKKPPAGAVSMFGGITPADLLKNLPKPTQTPALANLSDPLAQAPADDVQVKQEVNVVVRTVEAKGTSVLEQTTTTKVEVTKSKPETTSPVVATKPDTKPAKNLSSLKVRFFQLIIL